MSATLTWKLSPLQAKTGTAIGNLFADMVSMINANAADPLYSWQLASYNSGSTPYQITLKPKNGDPGRILILAYTTSPSINPVLFSTSPSSNRFFIAYFPNGNVDTPSNLNATSGAVMGDDTGCTMATFIGSPSNIYAANFQCSYVDSSEGCFFFFQNPAAATNIYGCGAGNLVVDDLDDAYPSAFGFGTSGGGILSLSSPSSSSNIGFVAPGVSPGAATPAARIFKDGTSKDIFQAFSPTGWASTAVGPNDVLTDTTNSKAYFCPILLMTGQKGNGFPLKMRQIAFGPQSIGPFPVYNETGPVVVAASPSAILTSVNGVAWFLNKKI